MFSTYGNLPTNRLVKANGSNVHGIVIGLCVELMNLNVFLIQS